MAYQDGVSTSAARAALLTVDLATLDPRDLAGLSDDQFRAIAVEAVRLQAEDRKENQILYYRAASAQAEKIHFSKAHLIGMGGGNRSSKTESCLVEIIACATGVFPKHYEAEFRRKFRGPINVRICIESLTTVLHPIMLPKLKWWVWSGISEQGGDLGHWGWVPKDCLIGGEWEKSWSEKLRVLRVLCLDPDDPEHVLGESSIQFMCLRGDQRVRFHAGHWRPISEVRVGHILRHPDGGRTCVTKTFKYENAPLFRVRCRGGHEIVATPNHLHPIADGGLKRTDRLALGDIIRVNRDVYSGLRDTTLEKWALGWCAIAIGDGCLRRRDFGFTAAPSGRVIADLPPLPPNTRLAQMTNPKEWRIWLTKGRRDNPLVVKLKGWGLWGLKSGDKFIPDEMVFQPAESRAYFLRHLWNTDGTINHKGRQGCYTTISRRLAYDVKYLLWGLGVKASVGDVRGRCGFTNKIIASFHVVVSGGAFDRFLAAMKGKDFSSIPVKNYGQVGQVQSIEEVSPADVYCITVDAPDHLFIVDGLATHNSYDQDPTDYASGTFHICHMDEPPTAAIWRENQARVLDVNGRIFLSMTWPDDASIGVDWIYDEVYEPGTPGPMKDPDIDWFELQTLDNQFIDRDVILARTASWSEQERQVRLKGQPLRFSNRIHPLFTDTTSTWCFTCGKNCIPIKDDAVVKPIGPETSIGSPTRHTCPCERRSSDLAEYVHVEEFDLGDNWPVIYVIDPHPRKPHMMLWVAVDPNDDLYVVEEKQIDGDAADVKALVDDTEEGLELDTRLRQMDPNTGRSPSGARRGVTWQDEFAEVGLQLELADDSDVGRKRVNQYLKPDPHTRRPRITFHPRCTVAIQSMKRHVWDDFRRSADRDLKQQPKDKYSDFPAMLKYCLNGDPSFRMLYAGAPVLTRGGTRRGVY